MLMLDSILRNLIHKEFYYYDAHNLVMQMNMHRMKNKTKIRMLWSIDRTLAIV